jgi:hypothetical protein
LEKFSIFAYFRRELETSYFGEDGKPSPILERTCFNLSDSEREVLILRQFRADLVAHPSLRCSKCNKEFRRKLYQDFHWCEVATQKNSVKLGIGMSWELDTMKSFIGEGWRDEVIADTEKFSKVREKKKYLTLIFC